MPKYEPLRERLARADGDAIELSFRMVAQNVTQEQLQSGRVPADTELLLGPEKEGRQPYAIERRVMVTGPVITIQTAPVSRGPTGGQ